MTPYREYLAAREAADAADRRIRDDETLIRAARAGDSDPHLQEVAADIRDHRETERRRAHRAAQEAYERFRTAKQAAAAQRHATAQREAEEAAERIKQFLARRQAADTDEDHADQHRQAADQHAQELTHE